MMRVSLDIKQVAIMLVLIALFILIVFLIRLAFKLIDTLRRVDDLLADTKRMTTIAAARTEQVDEQIDRILCKMVQVAEENEMLLAQMAVEETGFGKVADKAYKNHMASRMLYDAIKDMKTSGIVREDPQNRLIEIAEPVGLIMGIVPSTNPTSTAIFKSMIAIKSRNAIIFSAHPSAQKCTEKAAMAIILKS